MTAEPVRWRYGADFARDTCASILTFATVPDLAAQATRPVRRTFLASMELRVDVAVVAEATSGINGAGTKVRLAILLLTETPRNSSRRLLGG